MTAPTLGHTIIIILSFVILFQLLLQRSEYRKRQEEIREILERIESRLGSS